MTDDHRPTLDEAVQRAAVHVAESLARQDARSPRDAAVASLGPHASEQQIGDWIARFRPPHPLPEEGQRVAQEAAERGKEPPTYDE